MVSYITVNGEDIRVHVETELYLYARSTSAPLEKLNIAYIRDGWDPWCFVTIGNLCFPLVRSKDIFIRLCKNRLRERKCKRRLQQILHRLF